MGVREVKKEYRERIIKQRAGIPKEEKDKLDKMLASKFLSLLCYKHAKSIILYYSIKYESDTITIINEVLKAGKKVALPRCIPDKLEMEFFEIQNLEDLEKGSYGIHEPCKEKCKKINPLTFDIAVVPALAFDKNGYRIGYGKGYYDRFLDKFKGTKIGITYSALLENKLPRGRFDKKVDIIVTEKGVKPVENE